MTDKELDDLFQKKFSNHQMPVPSDMWEHVNPQKDKRRRAIIWWWSGLGIAALLVLIGTATWLYHTKPETTFITKKTKDTQTPNNEDRKENQLSGTPEQAIPENNTPGSVAGTNSSQTTTTNNHFNSRQQNFDINKSNHDYQTQAATREHPSIPGYSANSRGIVIQKGENVVSDAETDGKQARKSGGEISTPSTKEAITSSGQPAITLLQADSSALAASTSAKPQESKAQAIKVKKIHGEKAPSLELTIAGYGNSRNVYASKAEETGIVALGAMPTKEKVLMHSLSLSVRIDKPLFRHFSIKTGLQYFQTHQRVSYQYETVNQTTLVNSFDTNDTVRYARLQSQQPVVTGVYNSFGIPVLLSYHTGGDKMSLGATAGIMVNLVSWYSGNVPDAGYKQAIPAETAFRKNTGAALYAGITATRRIGSFQLFAEPHIQYTLSSMTKKDASFRQKITSYGIGIGIRKSIGK